MPEPDQMGFRDELDALVAKYREHGVPVGEMANELDDLLALLNEEEHASG